jgi:DNA-binding PadR family transcriptional regulator
MKMQHVLLTLVGATLSVVLALILVWYSKNSISNTVSRRQILQMIKSEEMSSSEIASAVSEASNSTVSPKRVPVLLVKLQEEGLVQKAGSNKYVISAKGMEALESIESMSKEFQKLGNIAQRTSAISKFVINEAIDRLTMFSGLDDATLKAGMPYGPEER